MTAMGIVTIRIPLVTWRDGRPRFIPGARARALGLQGVDLRWPAGVEADFAAHMPRPGVRNLGRWLTLDEAIIWSKMMQVEIERLRKAVDDGATTPRKLQNAAARAGRSLVTVGQLCQSFDASPRMQGREVAEGRKKRRPLAANTIRYYRNAGRLLERLDGGRVWNAPAVELTGRALTGVLDRVEVLHGLAQARAVRAYVSVVFAHGRRGRRVAHDPVAALEESLPVLAARVRPASVAELEHLVAVADALGLPDLGDVVMAGVWTGQRQNDRLALLSSAIGPDGILFAPNKKERGGQVERLLVPLASRLAARLEAARERRRAWRVKPLHVFACEATGQAWKADWYRKVYRQVRHAAATGRAETDAAGRLTRNAATVFGLIDVPARLAAAGLSPMPSLADLRDQDLRDTCLSWLPLAGADRFEIAGFSGHAFGQSEQVLRHYVAIPPEFARRGMARLEAWYDAQLGALRQEVQG